MTTGIVPDGAGRALELGDRLARRVAGELLDVDRVEHLEADRVAHRLEAGLHAGVAVGDGADRAAGMRTTLVLGEHAVGVGDEDPLAAVAVAGRHLHDRGAGRRGRRRRCARSSSTLAALATSSGSLLDACSTGCGADGVSATVRAPPPPWLRRGRGGLGGRRAGRARTGRRCGRSRCVSPATTRMPAPRSRPLVTCSTRPSSSPADVERLSSAYTSANSPPEPHRRGQHPFQHVVVDHGGHASGGPFGRRSDPVRIPCGRTDVDSVSRP